ncbi:chemotaxis protein CheW [Sulfurivirga sp.]|uniref:chemotaxis protein CheW n=1 Tax=Sulfurivirga sp. TaxID=2614236 RepID=UPI0025F818E2|nr:chemotaxis protein CheW [Sulfurivirga sp.]
MLQPTDQNKLKEEPFVSPVEADEEESIGPMQRCVLFNLDRETYGIDVSSIREVLRVGRIRTVPGADEKILGVINVRGVIVTVVDMRRMIDVPVSEITDRSRIIIVELDEERPVGLLVDNVMEVRDIPEKRIEPLGSSQEDNSRYIQGIAHYMEKVIILVDVFNLISDAE